jgi:TPR repeat protein
VDWKPEERADLEVAMRQGVAVVHYDCNSFHLLADCHPGGTYGFVGVTRKEQVISLQNADEAKANLPLNGGTLGASLARGSSLDIALLMIGKKSTTFTDLTRDDLVGKCDGATHFVRAATIGAFAMKTGASGEVKAAASFFGVGASGGSSSNKSVDNSDGDSSACNQADVDAPKPPSQCAALLRIQLAGIAAEAKPPETSAKQDATPATAKDATIKPPPADVSCPGGLVAVGGKCTAPVANVPHECRYGDPKDCAAQCDAGELASCATLGFMYTDMSHFVRYDEAKSLALFQKSCGGGNQAGCTGLGEAYRLGLGVAEDDTRAAKLFVTACAAGYADGCDNLGDFYDVGLGGVAKDQGHGMKLHLRACDAGSVDACIGVGENYEKGKFGFPTDLAAAVSYFARACAGGSKESCDDLGDRYTSGDGAPAVDKAKGLVYYQRGCTLGDSASCLSLGDAFSKGNGAPLDKAKAAGLYSRACKLYKNSPACKKVQP